MRKKLLYLIIFSLAFSLNLIHAEELDPSDIVVSYFEALKNGDIETVKRYIAGDFYEKYRVLFEQNESYPEFLRNFYQGSKIDILSSTKSGKDVIVQAEIHFPNAITSVNKLRLSNYNKNGWKIVEEIIDY